MAAPGRDEDDRGEARELPQPERPWPAPDDHLLRGEQPYELIDGRLVKVPPAGEAHARKHTTLGTLLEMHAAPGYLCASDLITRVADDSDFASDVCLYPAERDPQTGGRALETLAFEIRSQQSLADVTLKARRMTRRGVPRVFCVDLPAGRVLEWHAGEERWLALESGTRIEDACLVRPLEVAVLLDTTRRDAAVVAALRARKVPELEEIREEGERAGLARGQELGSQARLVRLVERRLQRPLSEMEHATVATLVERGQDDALEDALLEHDAAGLAAWLAEHRARFERST